MSHTLEGISNQPSTAVHAQMSSSRSGLTPEAEAETSVQADPVHGNRQWYCIILATAGKLASSVLFCFFEK